MAEAAAAWLKDVFFIIISMTFFRILVPDSKLSKYLNFIFSLVILAVILQPLSALLGVK